MVIASVAFLPAASAQVNSWTNGADGFWQDAPNWSLGTAPTNGHSILITNANTKIVTIDSTTSGSYPSTLTISSLNLGAPLNLTNTLLLANTGTSSPLQILNSATLTSGGVLFVTNSALVVQGGLTLGGVISVIDGKLIATNYSTTYVGYSGVGQMTVSNSIWQGYSAYVGYSGGSQGTLTMVGGTNTLPGGLTIGYNGTGTVWLTGGQLTTTNYSTTYVGYSGGVGQLTVSNSIWQGYSAYVGYSGGSQGTLTAVGGTLTGWGTVTIGYSSGSTGTVWIGGANVFVTNGTGTARLIVGDSGRGSLMLNNGTLTVDRLLANGGTRSAISFAGGLLNTKATSVTNSQVFIVGNGTNTAELHLDGGTHSFANGLLISSNAVLSGCGIINGSVVNDGSIRSDCAGGQLQFTGQITNNAVITATNGTTLVFGSAVVNNGTLDGTAGNLQFCGGWTNTGTILPMPPPASPSGLQAIPVGTSQISLGWQDNATDEDGYLVERSTNGVNFVSIAQLAPSTTNHLNTGLVPNSTYYYRVGATNAVGFAAYSSVVSATPGVNCWANSTDGAWDQETNWSAGLPYGEQTVWITNANTKTVWLTNAPPVETLTVSNLTVGALAGQTNTLRIGDLSPQPLVILNSFTLSSRGALLLEEGATQEVRGVFTVNGSATVNRGLLVASNTTTYIGYSGMGSQLVITNGGEVASRGSLVGYNPSSSNNVVLVSDTGSIWTNSSSLILGGLSSSNQLVITNGGSVFSASGYLGGSYGLPSWFRGSNNNSVVVTGTGSVWRLQGMMPSQPDNGSIYVGYNGSGNQLWIANGGAVVSSAGISSPWGSTYVGSGSQSRSNAVVVTGSGSVLSNIYGLYVGYQATGNQLVISNGGMVVDSIGYLGYINTSNNVAVVTGTGSVWRNQILYIGGVPGPGFISHNNRLSIADGGVVYAGNAVLNGYNNSIVLASGSLAGNLTVGVSNSVSGCGTITGRVINYGVVDVTCGGGTLTFMGAVQNWGAVQAHDGGIAEFYGPVVNFGGITNFSGGTVIFHDVFLGGAGTTNSWIATGDGAWEDAARWSLGTPSPDQTVLLITNANSKTVTVNSTTASLAPDSLTNVSVTISSGGGNTNTLRVADLSPTNPYFAVQLTVGPGGKLEITNSAVAVGLAGAGTLTVEGVTVVDGGTIAGNNASAYVGYSNGAAQFIVQNGGSVSNTTAYLGYNTSSSNNLVVISDPASIWKNTSSLYVGLSGGGNQLLVTNGGVVFSSSGYIGYYTSSSNNVAEVSDTGSIWTNSSSLYIGLSGSGNQLFVTNGGVVFNSTGYLGSDSTSSSNAVLISGTGSVWSSTRILYVGSSGSSNRLVIAAGGAAMASNMVVGLNTSASNNIVEVNDGLLLVTTDTGTGKLVLGQSGQGQLILNAGTVTVDALWLTNGINSVMTFNGGVLNSGGTTVSNGSEFAVGDSIDTATFDLAGGIHSFGNALRIHANAFLTGCGTINGSVVVDVGGTVLVDCGGGLTLTGILTNNGLLRVINGGVLEGYGTVVNNGTIDAINGTTNFHGAFINNGTLLDSTSVSISQTSQSGEDFVVQIPSVIGHTYQLQYTGSLTATNWNNTGIPQSGTGDVLTFTDLGGSTNTPARFYHVQVTAP